MTGFSNRVRVFRELHERGCFVIPNPWDVGSARVLAQLGFKALAISAHVMTQERDENGEIKTQIGRTQLAISFAIAIGFVLVLFKVGPALVTSWLPIHSTPLFVVVEGVIRVSVFIGYIALVSLLPDLRRVFQYHGAEHKAINALEAGAELTPTTVQKYSLIHPR